MHSNVTKKLRSLDNRFKVLKGIFSVEQLRTLYFALVESHLAYGIVTWGGVINAHLTSLNKAQKYIIKIIYNRQITYPTDALYIESNILDIRQLFCLFILVRQYKEKTRLIPVEHGSNTRSRETAAVVPKTVKTIIGQRSYYFQGPKMYNVIPVEIKLLNSVTHYKNKTKKWINSKNRLFIHSLVDLKNIYYNS